MARNLEFYKGSRKKRNYALIPFVIVLSLFVLAVVLFYTVQKYAVISKDGVEVVLPGMAQDETASVDSQGHEVKTFATVDAQLVFDTPDYSHVEATAGKNTGPVRAIYIPSEELNYDNLMEKAGRLSSGNALLLEMKPRSGALNWPSKSEAALSYGLYYQSTVTENIGAWVTELKSVTEKDIWLVAQISCCVDGMLASRATTFALRTDYGADYIDETGAWIDPYNAELRRYIVELCEELYAMGFDEVVLADVMHPVPETKQGQAPMKFMYSSEMSTTPTPVNAVCGFALYVANELKDRATGKLLSIYVNSARSLVGEDEGNGQNAPLFFKVFDRVYYNTDMYTFTYNLEDVVYSGAVTIGNPQSRFVPVVINYLPKHDSWIYIENLDALNKK